MPHPGFNISAFSAYINENGLQKPNKFLVRIPLPIGLQAHPEFADIISTARMLEYWAESAAIPGMTMVSHQNLRYGYGAYDKKPVYGLAQDIPVSFLDDGKGSIHHFFSEWQNMIFNKDMSKGILGGDRPTGQVNGKRLDPYEISYKYEYCSDISIVQFDDTGAETKSIILREAWPIDVGTIGLAWAAQNEVSRIQVVFTFQDWYSEFAPVRTNN